MNRRDHKRNLRRGDEDEDSGRMSRQQQRLELKALTKEARKRERDVVRRIIDRSNVVLCTCITAGSRLLEGVPFDMVVIDEAAQGLEAACWIPILKGRRCVLAGDHCQLPPTIKSQEAEKGGLGVTLFERIIKDPRFEGVVSLLDTQYRMNAKISDWASKHMYCDAIHSHCTVAEHTLSDFRVVHRSPIACDSSGAVDQDQDDGILSSFPVLLLVDTSECGMLEDSTTATDEGGSHRNYHEADLVYKHVVALVKAGIKPNQIGVITPYNAQLDVLRDLMLSTDSAVVDGSTTRKPTVTTSSGEGHKRSSSNALKADALSSSNASQLLQLEGLEIKTIDGFQGGEKECILLSLVRSNASHTLGFLGEKRRINVAVTRAKRHLAVFCDVSTCSVNLFMRGLLTHMATEGDHISADEYADYIVSGTSDSSYAASTRSKMIKDDVNRVKPCKLDKQDFISLLQRFQQCKLIIASEEERPAKVNSQPVDIQIVAASRGSGSDDSSQLEVIQVKYLPKDGILRFPSSLTSYQRMLIHECAEELQLHHRSENKISKAAAAGYERFIEVSMREFSMAGATDTLTTTDDDGPKRATNRTKTPKTASMATHAVADKPVTLSVIKDEGPVAGSMFDPLVEAQRTRPEHYAAIEEINSAASTPANEVGMSLGMRVDLKNSAVDKVASKKQSTRSSSSSTGKVYVSAERQSYQAVMEQQLHDTLRSTSAAEEDKLIEATILHNQVSIAEIGVAQLNFLINLRFD